MAAATQTEAALMFTRANQYNDLYARAVDDTSGGNRPALPTATQVLRGGGSAGTIEVPLTLDTELAALQRQRRFIFEKYGVDIY
jgi:hypothetical protein